MSPFIVERGKYVPEFNAHVIAMLKADLFAHHGVYGPLAEELWKATIKDYEYDLDPIFGGVEVFERFLPMLLLAIERGAKL